jgi:hypothetical protein
MATVPESIAAAEAPVGVPWRVAKRR